MAMQLVRNEIHVKETPVEREKGGGGGGGDREGGKVVWANSLLSRGEHLLAAL